MYLVKSCAGARLGLRTLELAEEVCSVQFVPVFGELPVYNAPDIDTSHHYALPGRSETQQRIRERARVRVATDDGSFFDGSHCDRVFTDNVYVRHCAEQLFEERGCTSSSRFYVRVVVDVVIAQKLAFHDIASVE